MNIVENFFDKLFPDKQLQPVDLAHALEKEADDKMITVGRDNKVIPNEFHLYLSTEDFDRFFDRAQIIADELAKSLTKHAEEKDYRPVGKIVVTIHEDNNLEASQYNIVCEDSTTNANTATASASRRSPAPPRPDTAYTPYLEINHQHYKLKNPVTLIGRNPDCDIIIDDSSVSRHHLTITLTEQGAIMEEVPNSKGQMPTNGTLVEGHRVSAVTLCNGNQITIGKTVIRYWDPEGEWERNTPQEP